MYKNKTIIVLILQALVLSAQQPVVDSTRAHHKSNVVVENKAAVTADSLQFEVVRNSKNPSDHQLKTPVKQKEVPSSTMRRKNTADYKHPHGF
jgi:hypothetical protein